MFFLLLTILWVAVLGYIASTSREGYFSVDPQDTGIERPLWGPLYTLPRRDRNRWLTMHETPWCVDPLKEEEKCALAWSTARCSVGATPGWDCGLETPYELDKI